MSDYHPEDLDRIIERERVVCFRPSVARDVNDHVNRTLRQSAWEQSPSFAEITASPFGTEWLKGLARGVRTLIRRNNTPPPAGDYGPFTDFTPYCYVAADHLEDDADAGNEISDAELTLVRVDLSPPPPDKLLITAAKNVGWAVMRSAGSLSFMTQTWFV